VPGYELLGLQTYFTAGVKEVRAWTANRAPTAPQAAGVIPQTLKRLYCGRSGQLYDFIQYKVAKVVQRSR